MIPINLKLNVFKSGKIHKTWSSLVESTHQAGDEGSISGSGRSPGGGNGNPRQYYYLGNPMDGGAWWDTA